MLHCSNLCSMEKGREPYEHHTESSSGSGSGRAAGQSRFRRGRQGCSPLAWDESPKFRRRALRLRRNRMPRLSSCARKPFRSCPARLASLCSIWQNSGFDRYAEIQKVAIDFFVEQSRAFADLLKERTATAEKVVEDADSFAKKSVERAVAMQKKALEHSAAQAKAVFESSSRQFGVEGSPVEAAADSIQRGVDAIVDAQKELLDMAVR